ncbi:MAG: NAD-dependent epimerase/dehydratase family protein [Candidatus Calescibacterium sp.]|nr:NAD-dependent epimerase/dehydratase family protein [Candidatus Calescibacterium sp.]MCX7972225.1 NAD-dependent epimerase/dehydratase family protein [bacterium]MDW8195174.1 NAD-dependent epimerase/dehydratase family protein [Candidatus Calescibacterium sp.]
MNKFVLLLGQTGLIGNKIYQHIKHMEYQKIYCLSRKSINYQDEKTIFVQYNDLETDLEEKLQTILEKNKGQWIVFLFTGETIFGFINDKKWQNIYKSRVKINQKVISVLEKLNIEVLKIFSASAIGIYYKSKDLEVDENSEIQDNIISNLIRDWEKTIIDSKYSDKSVIMRIGAVLDKKSKISQSLLVPSLFSIGINFSPSSYFPWIYNEEIPRIIEFLIQNDFTGIINTVSNNYITFREFLELYITTHSIFRKAFIIDLPLRILEKSLKLLMPKYYELPYSLFCSPKIIPHNLIKTGYSFKYNDIREIVGMI